MREIYEGTLENSTIIVGETHYYKKHLSRQDFRKC